MHIWSVTPIHVDPEELVRRQARYDALSPAGVRVELVDIGTDAPRQLATAQDVRDSEGLVASALANAPDHADALMPDCFLDPGVAELSAKLDRPVFGLLRTSTMWSVLSGRRFGAVTRNAAIGAEAERLIGVYGYASSFTGVDVLDLDVDAIHEGDRWGDALRSAVERTDRAGAEALLNGCSAVDLPADSVTWPVRVVDPTALTLRLIGAGELA
ncbi:MAG TPA: aspartate/glutamate racemase family protein [Lapillicoccus sp.]|nr:aspartate/glutamate racemase family protein [Lapillicoccus sp.]